MPLHMVQMMIGNTLYFELLNANNNWWLVGWSTYLFPGGHNSNIIKFYWRKIILFKQMPST